MSEIGESGSAALGPVLNLQPVPRRTSRLGGQVEHTYSGWPTQRRIGGSTPIAMLSIQQKGRHEFTQPATSDFLVVVARDADMKFSWDIGDGWTPKRSIRSGALQVVPPRTEISVRDEGSKDMLFIAVPDHDVADLLLRSGSSIGNLISQNTDHFYDSSMIRVVESMWELALSETPPSLLQMDGLLLSLLGQLLARAGRPMHLAGPELSRAQVDRLCDLIESNMGDTLTLEGLAQSLDLSRFQFLRSFKNATGQSPHQYVISRRLVRAQDLLARTDNPIADIAFECGFSSQSHLTDVFRKHLGISPGRYRLESR